MAVSERILSSDMYNWGISEDVNRIVVSTTHLFQNT